MAVGGAGAEAGAGLSPPSLEEIFKNATEMIETHAKREDGSTLPFCEPVLKEIRESYPLLLPLVGEREEGHPSEAVGTHKTPTFIGVSRFARVVTPSDPKPKNSVWVEIPIETGYRCSIVDSREKAIHDGRDGYVCFLADTDLLLRGPGSGRFLYESRNNERGYVHQYGSVSAEGGGTVLLEIQNNNLYLRDELSRDAFATNDNAAAAGAGKAKKPTTSRAGGAGAGPPLPRKRTRTRRQKHRKHNTRRRHTF